jgi:hypothetical protein
MGLPLWVSVVIARFAGGFAAGIVVAIFFVARFAHPAPGLMISQAQIETFMVIAAAAGTVGVAVALVLLVPRLSKVDVTPGTALLAALAGEAIPLAGSLLYAHEVSSSAQSPGALAVYGSMSPFLSLGLTVVGVMATVWIIGSASGPSGGKRRYDLYGKASRQSLDEDW